MEKIKDLIVIGGGINGTGIAADAAGRGLSVLLLEAEDLACGTSSVSSKLIHGGLRYLENYDFRLVRESLVEREIILKLAPHIAFPMRFCLPHSHHLRPAWMIRLGLFIYDFLASSSVSLPSSKSIKFGQDSILKPSFSRGFEYYDCWIDDARLVVLNAQEVIKHGSEVRTRFRVIRAWRENFLWSVSAENIDNGDIVIWKSRGLVNATGPWVKLVVDQVLHLPSAYGLRLIKGSHIVLPRVHDTKEAYILQNEDKRIIFVIPWLEEFSIIGTTDVEYYDDPKKATISDEEILYLLKVYNKYFKNIISKKDIIWSYSGVRPLCDDNSNLPQAITRNYSLVIDDLQGQTPLLSVFGGKLTTYRKLAEHALNILAKYFPNSGPAWTKHNILPGGNIINGNREDYADYLYHRYNFIGKPLAKRYAYTYGSHSELFLKDKKQLSELGINFGHNFYEAELYYLVNYEWVYKLDDAIWRRTRMGLWLNESQKKCIAEWLALHAKDSIINT
ncbi:MAG: glycerol-3-phosphate dehydrogenase [Candidatus Dasytiphilus stammeri]